MLSLEELKAGLESCMAQSRHAQALAEKGDWKTLDQVLLSRAELIRQTLLEPFVSGSEESIRSAIDVIKNCDAHIERLALAGRQKLTDELKQLSASNKATNAYTEKL